jgi:hypothetical protein
MKYIKQYEELKEPQIGDYVIATDSEINSLNTFLIKSIGKIVYRYSVFQDSITNNGPDYLISYEDIPENIKQDFHWPDDSRPFYKKEILHISPNKEDLKVYVNAIKYNL